jgi:serine/threonine protein kinase
VLNTILRGHYKIIRHLGGGGFGQTYLAEDVDLPKHPICVVKQLKPTSKEPFVLETSKRLFDQEAEILYALGTHDRIPRLLAHFQEEEEFYLVQEFADGNDLTHELGKGIRLPEALAISLIKEILEILVFVHERGVVHRDIKPANLIRRKSDRKIVLIDFGAVKEIGGLAIDSQGNTNLTIAIGSPGYMPIEQLNGKPRFSSDIYAVGMMGIQAITGAEPRLFPENPETAELLWRDRLPLGVYSAKFLDILDKMVRYDFRQRYQTDSEVLEAIASLLSITSHELITVVSRVTQHQDLQVGNPQNNQPSKKPLTWSKILIVGGSIVTMATLAIVAIAQFHKPTSPNQLTNAPLLLTSPVPLMPPPVPIAKESSTRNSPEDKLIQEARILITLDKFSEALLKAEEAIKLDPKNPNTWEVKGKILSKLHRDNEAISSFDKTIELRPNSPMAKQFREALITANAKPKPKKT